MPTNQVELRWQGQMRFEAHTHPDQTIALDAAPEHGGQEAGSRPLDMLLVGLAGCTAMDVVSILRKKRQPVTDLIVRVSGHRADDHPRVYTDIEVTYVVEGSGVDPSAVERAIELSETKYCPAWAMLRAKARITSRYEVQQVEAS